MHWQRVRPLGRLVSAALKNRLHLANPVASQKCLRIPLISTQIHTYKTAMEYGTIECGKPFTKDYRAFLTNSSGNVISPFHDIPLFANSEGSEDRVYNMVVEIPRWSNAKMEINKTEKLNPIKQDIKKDKLRFVKNVFPHHGYIWNYGALPQTYEDPKDINQDTGCGGDSDPLDVCEIGHKVHKRGSVIQVKILGTFALIDEGETDWKIMAIDITDPLAEKLNDIDDIEKEMPGFLKATEEWFRIYKIPDGKPENSFAFDGKAKDKKFAVNVIKETNEQWQKLVNGGSPAGSISCVNTCVGGSPDFISKEDATGIVEEVKQQCAGEESCLDTEVDKWHYVK